MEIYAYFYIYELENGHRHQRFRNFINPQRIDKQDKKKTYISQYKRTIVDPYNITWEGRLNMIELKTQQS